MKRTRIPWKWATVLLISGIYSVADRKPGWIPEEQRVPMAQLTPLMKEALSLGGSVELTVTGKSMRPLLLGGISRVRLRAVQELHRGDMLLYQRSSGA